MGRIRDKSQTRSGNTVLAMGNAIRKPGNNNLKWVLTASTN